MNSPSALNWRLRVLAIGAAIAPFLGIIVRLLTPSPARIAICGLIIWLYGVGTLSFLIHQIPPPRPSLIGRVLLWTISPFIPAYLASVLLTGALTKR